MQYQQSVSEYIIKHQRRKVWQKIVLFLACIVVFCTTYALILPAITQEQTAYCGYEEHTHTQACYVYPKTSPQLICTLLETTGQTNNTALPPADAGYFLPDDTQVYTEPSPADAGYLLSADTQVYPSGSHNGHTHDASCYAVQTSKNPELVCGLVEHVHSLSCYADETADLETSHVWTATIPSDLTGVWAADLVEVAKSQLGYQESSSNYHVVNESILKGYTRYGAWAGDPYGDWSVYFTQFCLHYAGVPALAFPSNDTVQDWIFDLAAWDQYIENPDYIPAPGDVVFLNMGEAPLMGIVSDVDAAGYVTAIIGDLQNAVRTETFAPNAQVISGYGIMPANDAPPPEEGTQTPEITSPSQPEVMSLTGVVVDMETTEFENGDVFTFDATFDFQPTADTVYVLELDTHFKAATAQSSTSKDGYSYRIDDNLIYITYALDETGWATDTVTITGTVEHSGEDAMQLYPLAEKPMLFMMMALAEEQKVFESSFTGGTLTVTTTDSAGALNGVDKIVLIPVDADSSAYTTMVNKESIAKKRTFDRRMYQLQFQDSSGSPVYPNVWDLSLEVQVSWDSGFSSLGTNNTALYTFLYCDNQVKELSETYSSAANSAGVTLTNIRVSQNMPCYLDFAVANDQLAEGTYRDSTLKYNPQKDAFIYDPEYAYFYNDNSPLGTAGSFHLVAFGDANLNTHTNGNVLAKNLYAPSNFGTNPKDGYEGFRELHYVQNYLQVNDSSSARTTDILVLGSDNTLEIVNGNEFVINAKKIGKPKNVVHDEDTSARPFIDLTRVENEIKTISANLGAYPTITNPNEMAYNTDKSKGELYIEILGKDNIGVLNTDAATIAAMGGGGAANFNMKGFESGGSGAIIINVDCAQWPRDEKLYLPTSRVYVDGKMQDVSETLDFSAGKVIWNFINAADVHIETHIMTGMVIAPDSTVSIGQNLNGNVVAENINVNAESHRTDFIGKIYLNEFREGAHIHVYKVDKGNYGDYLDGAHFSLYQWDNTAQAYVPADLGTDENGAVYPTSAVSDQNGLAFFGGLRYNVAYKVVETRAPDNYIPDTDGIYIFYENADTSTYPISKPADFQGSNLVNDCYIHHMPNAPSEVPITSLTMRKVWTDQNGAPLPHEPESVTFEVWRSQKTVTIAADGTKTYGNAGGDALYGSYTLTKEDGWMLTVNALPKTNGDGSVEYTYYVKEAQIDGCLDSTIEYSDDRTSVTITNKMEVKWEYGTMAMSKDWMATTAAPMAADEIPVDKITFTLYRVSSTSPEGPWSDPEAIKTVTVSAAQNWSWAEDNLEKSVTVGTTTYYFAYYADETLIPGFAPSGNIDQSTAVPVPNEMELTNTPIPKTNLVVNKIWTDAQGNPETDITHDPITVSVYRWENGVKIPEPVTELTLSADTSWTAALNDLYLTDPYGKLQYTYTVEEAPVPGYAASYAVDETNGATTVTITNREATYTWLTVTKNWADSENNPIQPPTDISGVQVEVYRHVNGVKEDAVFQTLTLNAENSWSTTLSELLAYNGTDQYTYSAEEVSVPGYEAGYHTQTQDGGTHVTITNTALGDKTSITVKKKWFRGNVDVTSSETTPVQFYLYQHAFGATADKTPVNINLDLTAFGYPAEQFTGYVGDTLQFQVTWTRQSGYEWITEDNIDNQVNIVLNNWSGNISCSNKTAAGNKVRITYELALTDTVVAKYGNSITITGHQYLKPEHWSDVQSTLISAGSAPYSGPHTLGPDNNWRLTLSNLPRVETDAAGNETIYSYYVKEIDGELYDVSYENNDTTNGIQSGTITIKNKTNDNKTALVVEKKWLDADGNVLKNPSGEIQFKLYQVGSDGVTTPYPDAESVHTLGLTQNGWKTTFSALPLTNEAGTVTYRYYVEELDSAQYTVTYATADGTAVGPQTPVDSDTIVITNQIQPSFMLPETGGMGTAPYTVLGFALVCVSTYLLFRRGRRGREARG